MVRDERQPALYPLRFEPILKRLIWGGRRLGTVLHKPIGEGSDYAESWEISDHRDDISRVAECGLTGASLRELIERRPLELLGPAHCSREQFPLLAKFIDARETLSVQVHPNDALAQRLASDNGKTETWVVVAAEPGALIYSGLQPGVTREQFRRALNSPAIEPLLHRFPATPGDCIMVPAGTVHAIGAGVLLAEVQQMSDATFRVYDWGRLGPDGKRRKLHLDEALESIDFDAGPVDPLIPETEAIDGGLRDRLSRCEHFALDRLRLTGPAQVGSAERFTILICLRGAAEIHTSGEHYPLRFGETRLLPAACGTCDLVPRGSDATVLVCVVP